MIAVSERNSEKSSSVPYNGIRYKAEGESPQNVKREGHPMQLQTLKKVTIIIEDSMKHDLLKKLLELGASGYTCHEVQGYGSRGARNDAFGGNVEVQLICPEPVATAILTHVSHHYFEHYACIAWTSDVSVVRGQRYSKA